jgi:hypothetical protein
VDEKIRALRLTGWSERRIAAKLGITRHRVRVALEGFRPSTPIRGASWSEWLVAVIASAKYRKADAEQLPLAELAYDTAEWLDKNDDGSFDARQVAGSLYYVVEGVLSGSDPLVLLHARRARRLMTESKEQKTA